MLLLSLPPPGTRQYKEHWAPSQETFTVNLLFIHSIPHLFLDSLISENNKQMVVMFAQQRGHMECR